MAAPRMLCPGPSRTRPRIGSCSGSSAGSDLRREADMHSHGQHHHGRPARRRLGGSKGRFAMNRRGHARNHDCSAGVSREWHSQRPRLPPTAASATNAMAHAMPSAPPNTRASAPMPARTASLISISARRFAAQQLSSLGLAVARDRSARRPSCPQGHCPRHALLFAPAMQASREAPERWRTQATHAE